jgi:hypothetical protein
MHRLLQEVANARVHGGVHFRSSSEVGAAMGKKISVGGREFAAPAEAATAWNAKLAVTHSSGSSLVKADLSRS